MSVCRPTNFKILVDAYLILLLSQLYPMTIFKRHVMYDPRERKLILFMIKAIKLDYCRF